MTCWPECPNCGEYLDGNGPVGARVGCRHCGRGIGWFTGSWNFYEALGVLPSATTDAIFDGYARAMTFWGQLVESGQVTREQADEACDGLGHYLATLEDPERRAEHDEFIREFSHLLLVDGLIQIPRLSGYDIDECHSMWWLRRAVAAGVPGDQRRLREMVLDAALGGQHAIPTRERDTERAKVAAYTRLMLALARSSSDVVRDGLWGATRWQWRQIDPAVRWRVTIGPPPDAVDQLI